MWLQCVWGHLEAVVAFGSLVCCGNQGDTCGRSVPSFIAGPVCQQACECSCTGLPETDLQKLEYALTARDAEDPFVQECELDPLVLKVPVVMVPLAGAVSGRVASIPGPRVASCKITRRDHGAKGGDGFTAGGGTLSS